MPACHFAQKNIWILKPTGLNRGKGIHVVDKISDVKKIIKQTCLENKQPQPKQIKQPGKSLEANASIY